MSAEQLQALGPSPARWREHVAALGIVVLLAAAGYGHLLAPGRTLYSPHSDFLAEHLSTKQVLYDSVRQGHGIPLWRSDQFSGYAGLTNPQALFTYPLHALFLILPALQAVGPTFWLHFLAAGVAYYLVGSALGLGFPARVLMTAAGMFQFKLILATYAGWLPIVPIITLFPVLFAGVFYLFRRPGLPAALALAAAGSLCLHAGHLQLFYYSVLFLVVYATIELVRLARARAWTAAATGGWLVLAGALATGSVAYLMLPLAAEAPLLSRRDTSYEYFLSGHALGPRHLLTFLCPEALGTPLKGTYAGEELWEDVAYFGLIPLVLAAAGVVLARKRHPARFLAAGFVAALLLSADSPVLRGLFEWLPGFDLFRCPGRFLFLAAFFGICLAGVGLEAVATRLRPATSRTVLLGGVIVLLALVAGEGALHARRYLKMAPPAEALPAADYDGLLTQGPGPFRVAPAGRFTLNYGSAGVKGLQLVTGYDSYNYRHYQTYMDVLQWARIRRPVTGPWCDLDDIARPDLLDALGARYLVSPGPLAFPGRFRRLGFFAGQRTFRLYKGVQPLDVYVYENTRALPRAFLVQRVLAARDETAAVALLQQSDLHTTAVVMTERSFDISPGADGDGAEVLEARPGRLSIRTNLQGARFLVIGEVWHPGWQGRLDGGRLVLYRADYALLGAAVPPGEHLLELRFRPLHWPAALWLSAGAGLVFLGLLAWAMAGRAFRRLRHAKA